MLADSFLLV